MQRFTRAIVLLFAMTTCLFASEENNDSLNDLIKELRAITPDGWKVSINRFNEEDTQKSIHVEIWKEKKVQFLPYENLYDSKPWNEPEPLNPPEIFYFNFYLIDYISPKDYIRFKKENAIIKKRMIEFTKELSDIKRHGRIKASGDISSAGYFPKTEDEKERVQKFIDYKKSHPLHSINNKFHYKKKSFHFFDPRSLGKLESKHTDKECTEVLKSIMKVLKPYDTKIKN